MNPTKHRLGSADWTDAALAAMAEQGTAGINVEQLARRLGATKGSFYHHFENRQELLRAALARWEQLVDDDLAAASHIPDPRSRLLASATAAVRSELDGFVDLALGASISDPDVAATVQRINERRLDFLEALLLVLGVPEGLSRQRAIGGLSTYLGLYQLQRMTGERFDSERLDMLVSDAVDAMLRT